MQGGSEWRKRFTRDIDRMDPGVCILTCGHEVQHTDRFQPYEHKHFCTECARAAVIKEMQKGGPYYVHLMERE